MARIIGKELQEERERRGLSLEDVAHLTRIPAARLAQLEAEDFHAVGSPAYAAGFLKLYAEALELDADLEETLRSLRREAATVPKVTALRPTHRKLDFSTVAPRPGPGPSRGLAVAAAAALALLGASFWYGSQEMEEAEATPNVSAVELQTERPPMMSLSDNGTGGRFATARWLGAAAPQ